MNRRSWFWRVSTIVGFALALGFFSSGISSSYATEESSGDNGTDIAAVGAVDGNAADNHDAAAYDTAAAAAAAGEDFDEDPWEGFNEKMFWFNREVLDRYVLKPVATAWDFILPDPVQRGVHNFFDNLQVVRRVVNNGLQAKPMGAATELARFTINSTIGLVGFFDVAKDAFGIEQRDEDTGQTFGVWGAGPGPYLVLPLLPPLTVRDGIGYAFDAAMTPYTYFIPWWGSVAATGTSVVNERSLNLDRFERVAESTVDLYGAVRNAYLQRRAAAIKQ
ncbi:MAG TPA: VacJ family lipoprotein [Verrucomicrobiae bacterium]|nr:VacJ family lipoprotein [Verrucomicrobiae bacterium]